MYNGATTGGVNMFTTQQAYQTGFPYATVAANAPPPGFWTYAPYGTTAAAGQNVVQDGGATGAEEQAGGLPTTLIAAQTAAPGTLVPTMTGGVWHVAEADAKDVGAMRERDMKVQRRKEANRESARRSKQRKKEESELLARRAQELAVEGAALRAQLNQLQEHCARLTAENAKLRELDRKSVV